MLRFNGQRAQNTIIFTFILMLIFVIKLGMFHFKYDYPINLELERLFEIKTSLSEIIELLSTMITIAQNVVFMQWFRRAYYNLHQKTDGLAYTEGWAVASWFIPIISLYRPFIIMKELYVETGKLLEEKYFIIFKKLNINLLFFWWLLYICSSVIGWTSIYYAFNLENLSELEVYYGLTKVNYIALILFSLINLKVIRDYSSMENLWKKFDDKKPTNEHDLDENE
ncbi:hypothetical protein AD998_17870 [bacterium 336/3]|nr:hypothetical protein AD998_17870 [bacterium 336/3]